MEITLVSFRLSILSRLSCLFSSFAVSVMSRVNDLSLIFFMIIGTFFYVDW